MKFTATQIAEVLVGTIEGDPEAEVSDLAKIEQGKPGTLTFLSNPKYIDYIYDTQASICIVNADLKLKQTVTPTLIRVENAYSAFTKLLQLYDEAKKQKSGLEQPHHIAESASYGENIYLGAFSYIGDGVTIGNNVKIYPNVYIGENTKIGDDVTIFSGAQIYDNMVIGNRCIIHSNVVIGGDGFGFAPDEKGVYSKIPQIGNVVIEDDVEIGAAATIDRATIGSTLIRQGVKLDNHVQIAHNAEIGEHTAIAAQSGIAGSTKLGKHCLIGGQVGIAGHLKIGDGVKMQAQTGVRGDIKAKEVLMGTPSLPYMTYNKSYIYFKNLPKLDKRLREVEKKLENNGG